LPIAFPERISLSQIEPYRLEELINSGEIFKKVFCAETGQHGIVTTGEQTTPQENHINFLCPETGEIISVEIVIVDGKPQAQAFFINTAKNDRSHFPRMILPMGGGDTGFNFPAVIIADSPTH